MRRTQLLATMSAVALRSSGMRLHPRQRRLKTAQNAGSLRHVSRGGGRMRVVAAATCAPARVYANRLDARVRCNDILHVQRPPIREQFENLLDKLTRRCV